MSRAQFKALSELLNTLGIQQGFAGQNKEWQTAQFLSSNLRFEVAFRKKKASKPNPYSEISLLLYVSDPDSALDQLKRKGFHVVRERSSTDTETSLGHFIVVLPDGLHVWIMGLRVVETSDPDHIGIEGHLSSNGKHFGIVVSRFNSLITERLLSGALDALLRTGAKRSDIKIVRVPGAFEIPSAARTLAQTGTVDAIVCLGCLLRGETSNYEHICEEVTRGVGQSAQQTGVPHAWGVLTCDNLEQAIDRAGLKSGNKGFEAALSAVEMASLGRVLSPQSPVKKPVSTRRSAFGSGNRNQKKNASKQRRNK